ncbi:hypothetical protein Afil01_30980 [Actinorhabdospora filicis]|uniref:Ig-like domain-containing protein n=1 Tax=Actinorhabdospora filicis TaxID=1785913 RepID=A0A9W6WA68_9ACTN|nr:hypothetical protein [Actinorhabdospora filicis]GLZ78291.1 hypothetical protein Afil01_30980 [Actinorhabdospora filicis]
MRITRAIPALAAVTLLLTATPATADPATPSPVDTVTLPGGDRVHLKPDGTYAFTAADGRENIGHRAVRGPGGDLIVTPLDATADPRRYNVSALARAGQPDASAAPESALAAVAEDDGDGTQVTVTIRDRHGKVPDTAYGTLVALDGSVWESFAVDSRGSAVVAVPPGDYVMLADLTDEPEPGRKGEYVTMSKRVTVGTTPLALNPSVVASTPVAAVTQRPGSITEQSMTLRWASDDVRFSNEVTLNGDYRVFALPVTDPALLWAYQPTIAVNGSADLYRLEFHGTGKVPFGMIQPVRDADLAAVTVDYPGFGTPFTGARLCYSRYIRALDIGTCTNERVNLPTKRTEYLSTSPETIHGWGLDLRDGPAWLEYSTPELKYTPGPHSLVLCEGPVGYSVRPFSTGGPDSGPTGMYRKDDLFYFSFEQLDTPDAGTFYISGGNEWESPMNNTMLVLKDGAELNRITGELRWVDTGLEEGSSGRYQVTIDSHPTMSYLGAATAMNLDWSFNSSPSADPEAMVPLAFSAVVLDATGVRGLTADATTDQQITLDYVSQGGGIDATAQTLTLELSYDDGATWTPVALNRNGDKATATVHHPTGAKHVSVRTSATDDLGSAITQTTIRAWLLK